MPRKARIDAPGALHHIICRGIERRKIFLDNEDRNHFIKRLADVLSQTSTSCFAWALIPNHFHLLLKTGSVPISTVMRKLLTGYAVTFNHRHGRHGRLFQNRYKSILCQEDTYLLELVRYIHLNPLRAKLVSSIKELHQYPYSGHSRLLGGNQSEWQDIGYVLGHFGRNTAVARKKYAEFVEEGCAQGRKKELTGGGLVRSVGGWQKVHALRKMNSHFHNDERILGDSDFVARVLRDAEEALARREQYRQEGLGFDEILHQVAQLYQLDPRELMTPGKQPLRVQARSVLCYWAVRELGLGVTSVAKKLGLTQPAASRAVQRGESLVHEHKYSLDKIRKRIKT